MHSLRSLRALRSLLRPALRHAGAVVPVALIVCSAAAVTPTPAPTPAAAPAPASAASAPVIAGGVGSQLAFSRARDRLLQVRTLLRGQDSQASVGSGFIVTADGHLITNYHVVSQYALRPRQYRLVFATADGRQGALQLLDVDVVHDLALLKPVDATLLRGRGVLDFRADSDPVQRGERIHALGNPLDVGFAVVEGSYNGLAERGYLPTIFFGGSLSSGMSGGPTLDDLGRVVGINVATRRDGEQVSFLVPATFARALLNKSRNAPPVTEPLYPRLVQQLTAHQDVLTAAFVAQPWRSAGHAHYAIPVPQEAFMRCWGRATPPESKGLAFERSDCEMDSRVFVNGALLTGYFSVRHESYDGRRIGAARFVERYSSSFRNERFVGNRQQTPPQCHERYVDDRSLPLRAVLCMRAYKKLPGLYDMSLLVATLDGRTTGAQGRFDAAGVSFANAERLAAHYLAGFGLVDAGRKPAAP